MPWSVMRSTGSAAEALSLISEPLTSTSPRPPSTDVMAAVSETLAPAWVSTFTPLASSMIVFLPTSSWMTMPFWSIVIT